MTDILYLAALMLATSASFFFSGIETGIYALNRVRLRVRAERGDPRAVRLSELVRRPQILISVILIGNHTANSIATYFCQGMVRDLSGLSDPDLATPLILTPFLFVLGEITPKNLFRIRAETLVYRWSGLLAGVTRFLRPIALVLRWLGRITGALPRSLPPPDAMLSRDRLRSLVREVTEDGILTDNQSRMVRNVLRLATMSVRDAMVPLAAVDSVESGFGRDELLRASEAHGRTRIPVLDPEAGRLTGIVNVLDLVFREDAGSADLVRTAPEIPERYSVEQALRILRRARQPMGFVLGADGAPIGIVTMKDLVEEVSGELPAF